MLSSRLRTVCFAGLFVGCAALLGVGCSDDSTKKVHSGGSGEAGEAGEPGAGGLGGKGGTGGVTPTGGDAGAVSEAGQGGAPVGAAGAPAAGAPALSEAGAGGNAGAAGAGPLACVTSGTVNNLSIPEQARKTVCRGTSQVFDFSASTTDPTFTCCSPFGEVIGLGGDGSGQFGFTVPADAPFGQQSISATCSEGLVTGSMDIDVSDSAIPPEADALERAIITQGDSIQIDGNHLDLVSRVTLTSADDATFSTSCTIDPEQSTNLTLVCNVTPPAGNYFVVVTEDDCGSVVVKQTLTIQQNT